jgi:hypothetical protein
MAQKRFWTEEKTSVLKTEYSKKDYHALAEILGCNVKALQNQAYKIGLSVKEGKWTFKEEALLVKYYPKTNNEKIAILLGRTESSIRMKAQKLKLTKLDNYHWTVAQEQYLIECYGVLPIWELQDIFKKTKSAIISKYRALSVITEG